MTDLRRILSKHVSNGSMPGAVGLVARGGRVEVQAVGSLGTRADPGDGTPMTRDTIFRIASMTKPLTAAAVMMLVEEGRLALDDAVAPWLPELASPAVLRTPDGPLDDVVPATRQITVEDLLTFRSGHGMPSDFSLPVVGLLFDELKQGLQQQAVAPPDEWMAKLGGIPLLHQPGDGWLYNTGSDILGVLIARVSGSSLPDFLAERLFEPLGMTDTGFAVPAAELGRFACFYRSGGPDGGLELVDAAEGQWSSLPAFPSGAGGLVSTADDWYAFARLLLAEGTVEAAGSGAEGRRLLSPASVRRMMTNHLTEPQRVAGALFREGQGWGYGGSVDIRRVNPWNVPGRYGWVGGTGTAAHLVPSTGDVAILLTQLEMAGPTPPASMTDFWQYAAA